MPLSSAFLPLAATFVHLVAPTSLHRDPPAALAPAATARITFRQPAESGTPIDILVDGKPFTSLIVDTLKKPALFPLVSPAGHQLSRGYPLQPRPNESRDHPHHTSLWFAHGDVNGSDFWHGADNARIVPVAVPVCEQAADHVSVAADFNWIGKDKATLCVEHRVMHFRATATSRTIDFDITLTAQDEPITFGDTKEGTFGLRLASFLQLKGAEATGTAVSSTGEKNENCWGKRAAWLRFAGVAGGTEISIAIFDHPANPRHPTWWHARDYGLFAANPFGIHDFENKPAGVGDFTIASGASVRFQYRLAIQEGTISTDDLNAAFAEYAAVASEKPLTRHPESQTARDSPAEAVR